MELLENIYGMSDLKTKKPKRKISANYLFISVIYSLPAVMVVHLFRSKRMNIFKYIQGVNCVKNAFL